MEENLFDKPVNKVPQESTYWKYEISDNAANALSLFFNFKITWKYDTICHFIQFLHSLMRKGKGTQYSSLVHHCCTNT